MSGCEIRGDVLYSAEDFRLARPDWFWPFGRVQLLPNCFFILMKLEFGAFRSRIVGNKLLVVVDLVCLWVWRRGNSL